MSFLEEIEKELNKTKTENDANALKSTGNECLNLFGQLGALRNREYVEIQRLFVRAYNEEPLLAMKMLFYLRDIRGMGLGERKVFNEALNLFAKLHSKSIKKNIDLIPFFGRWDDLFCLLETPVEKEMINLIKSQLDEDLESDNPSLLGKWMKSENTSNKESKKIAHKLRKGLGLSHKDYRKMLSKLRKKIDIVERNMSNNEWKEINYEKVPSNAMNKYRNAFKIRDELRFKKYIDDVKEGTKKINSGTLFPYDITYKIAKGEYSDVLDEQWKALPNYIEGENNMLVMADVSGSMRGVPIATSVGLAIYFAEKNKGAYHNKFMTFSQNPQLVTISGDTITEKYRSVSRADWNMNTDLERALLNILKVAIDNNLEQSELPKSLIIITDMQFDGCVSNANDDTFYDKMKQCYNNKDYEVPNIVFWNVDSRSDTFQTNSLQEGVQLASGHSASVFNSVIKNINLTPLTAMLNTLNDERYDCVSI